MTKSNRSRIAFLLGAGASRDGGLPLTSDFFVYLGTAFSADKEKAESEQERNLIEKERALFWRVRHRLKEADTPFVDADNFEDVIAAVDELRHKYRSRLFSFVENWDSWLKDFEGHGGQSGGLAGIPEEFPRPWHELFRAYADKFTRSEGLVYDRLVNRVQWALRDWLRITDEHDFSYLTRLLDFGPPAQVFTVNYDLAVEQACHHADIPWTTGFSPEGQWSPGLLDEPQYKLKLYKLHGSVAWYHPRRTGTSSFVVPVMEHPAGNWGEIYDGENASLEKWFALLGYEPPVMIFARGVKLPGLDPYITLLSKFLQAMREAVCLVTIGCRWNADPLIRDAILNGTGSGLQLIQVTKSDEPSSPGMLTCGAREALTSGLLHKQIDEILEKRELAIRQTAMIEQQMEQLKQVSRRRETQV